MRTTPRGGGEDDLDLLATRKTTHGVVGGELRLETKVLEVLWRGQKRSASEPAEHVIFPETHLLDLLPDEGTEETSLLGLTRVDLDDL